MSSYFPAVTIAVYSFEYCHFIAEFAEAKKMTMGIINPRGLSSSTTPNFYHAQWSEFQSHPYLSFFYQTREPGLMLSAIETLNISNFILIDSSKELYEKINSICEKRGLTLLDKSPDPLLDIENLDKLSYILNGKGNS